MLLGVSVTLDVENGVGETVKLPVPVGLDDIVILRVVLWLVVELMDSVKEPDELIDAVALCE